VDVDEFWATVDASRTDVDADDPEAAAEGQVAALREELRALDVKQLLVFQRQLNEQSARANDWRVWAAGYLAAGGMSDDAFDYFRLWLVMQGRQAFERVLGDPDQLADLSWDEEGAAFDVGETLGYLVAEVLVDRGVNPGEALVTATGAGEPAGEPFDEDDDEWFAASFPRLWERTRLIIAEPDSAPEPQRIGQADVVAFVDRTTHAKAPGQVERLPALRAALLYEVGEIREQDRPMLAAHWLAEGLGGEAVLELASLGGNEPEVNELWTLALAELGVTLPVTRGREGAAWAAQRVLDGERDMFWLADFLRSRSAGSGDPALDQLARDLYVAVLNGRPTHASVEALAGDDPTRALAELDDT
jgi:hypothetical protein